MASFRGAELSLKADTWLSLSDVSGLVALLCTLENINVASLDHKS